MVPTFARYEQYLFQSVTEISVTIILDNMRKAFKAQNCISTEIDDKIFVDQPILKTLRHRKIFDVEISMINVHVVITEILIRCNGFEDHEL